MKKLYYAEIYFSSKLDMLYALHPQIYVAFERDDIEGRQRHQKNWTPFEYCPECIYERGSVVPYKSGHSRSQLLFSYSLDPHIVVQTYPTNITSNHHVAERVFETEILPQDVWQWGEMRG